MKTHIVGANTAEAFCGRLVKSSWNVERWETLASKGPHAHRRNVICRDCSMEFDARADDASLRNSDVIEREGM